MIDPVQSVEAFLKIFPGPFKVSEMQTGSVGGPYESDFMVQCQKSCKVLQAHATKVEADAQADALNAIPVLIESLKTAEAVCDLVYSAHVASTPGDDKFSDAQVERMRDVFGDEAANLLLALRTHTKARKK